MTDSTAVVPAPATAPVPPADPEWFGKAFAAVLGEWMEKSIQGQVLNVKPPQDGPVSHFVDPWELLSWYGARQRATVLTYGMLREMARACKPVGAIVKTRQNQVSRFCRLPRGRGDAGFSLRLRDQDAKPTAADKKRIKDLETWVIQMGVAPSFDKHGLGRRPGLEHFMRMIVRDSLILDSAAFEPRRNLKGELYDVWPIDGGTIRIAGARYRPQLATTYQRGVEVAYIQEWNGQVLTEYGIEELVYCIRNPRTDIMANGYGFSELEELIETVTAILNAEQYNARYFTQNSLPEGVLSIVGQLSQVNLDAFKRAWNAMVSGVVNAWKVPIIATPDGKGVTFTPFKMSNKEMGFHEYLDWLVTIACAIYQTDREEIGFPGKQAGESSSLQGGNNESTLQHSMSKGFYPLMTFLESIINQFIVWDLDDNFKFSWEGVEPDREQQLWTMNKEKLQAGVMTARQYWKENDIEDDYPHMMWPDCPPNATLQGVYMQESGIMNMNQDQPDDEEEDGAGAPEGDVDAGEQGQGGPPGA